MKARLVELFRSIQGEGKYLGTTQIFLRFFECNMHCVWCDTPHSIGDTTRRYKEYSLDELAFLTQELWTPDCHSVSITGGEPLMQAEFLQQFIPILRSLKMPIHLETNGIMPNELTQVIELVDVVAMDLKLPSSTQQPSYWEEHKDFLKIALQKETFIKTVVSLATTEEDLRQAVDLVAEIDPDVLFILQPNYGDISQGIVNKCIEFQHYCIGKLKNVRIIPQTHKLLKVR